MSLYLQKTKIINIGPIKNIELKFTGPGVYTIAGRNNAGKTSTLQAIAYLLQPLPKGTGNPLKNGEKSGDIIAWLGDSGDGLTVLDGSETEQYKYKLSRHITPSGVGSVVCEYVGPDFSGKVEAKQVLSQFVSDMKSFDPWAFVQMKDSDQMAAVLKIVDIKLDKNKLIDIIGIDLERFKMVWPNCDPLNTIDSLYSKLYAMRTDTNRYLEQAKALVSTTHIPDEWKKAKPVKLADLLAEKKVLEDREKANDAEHAKLIQLKVDRDTRLSEFNKTMKDEQDLISSKEAEIKEYQKLIDNCRAIIVQIKENGIKERTILKAEAEVLNANIINQREIIDNLLPVDYTEINEKMAKADETNIWAGKVETLKIQEAEVNKLSAQSINCTIKMTKITEYKKELLENTKFPCEGMSFADGKVTMKDKNGMSMPLRSFGGATQLIAAFEILRAQNPKLKTVLSFSETQLDDENTKILEELVTKYGFQFLTAKVANKSEEGMFFIEGGECV